jgi:hypothetical protein
MESEEPRALTGNAADEEQVVAAGRKEKRRRLRELNDLRAVLGTAEGRRVLWRLLEFTGPRRTAYAFTDTNQTHFNLGQQNVGLHLQAEIIQASDDAYLLMTREARHEEEQNG